MPNTDRLIAPLGVCVCSVSTKVENLSVFELPGLYTVISNAFGSSRKCTGYLFTCSSIHYLGAL